MTLRVLPLRPPHVADETLTSYVIRSAAELGIPPSRFIEAAGLSADAAPGGSRFLFGFTMSAAQRRTFTRIVGLTDEAVDLMQLSRYDNIACSIPCDPVWTPSTFRDFTRSAWVYFTGSRLCPECLAEDGAWRISWKLPWSFACLHHRRLLADCCPGCASRPAGGSGGGCMMPPFRTRILDPARCSNPHAPRGYHRHGVWPCGYPLAEIDTDSVNSLGSLLRCQSDLQRALAGAAVAIGGRPVTQLEFFASLRSLCALMLYVAGNISFPELPPAAAQAIQVWAERQRYLAKRRAKTRTSGGNWRHSARMRCFFTPPWSVPLLAAVVPATLTVLTAPSEATLSGRLAPYIDAARRRDRDVANGVWKSFSFPPTLLAAFDECRRPVACFTDQAGMNAHRLARYRRVYRFGPEHVPQILPLTTYQKRFDGLIPGRGSDAVRRLCAMALVKLCGPHSWATAARRLRLRNIDGHVFANGMMTALGKAGCATEFAARLNLTARQLEATNPKVDYAARRRVLAGLIRVHGRAWRKICRDADINPGKRGGRNRYAAVWVWTELTQGDYRLAPGLQGLKPHDARETYRRFAREIAPRVADQLRAYGMRLMSRSGRAQRARAARAS